MNPVLRAADICVCVCVNESYVVDLVMRAAGAGAAPSERLLRVRGFQTRP